MTFEEYTDIVSDGGMDPRHQYEQEEKAKAVWEQAYLCGFSDSRKRINLLEQRVIDLQGHDDLSYLDKKLSEQESE